MTRLHLLRRCTAAVAVALGAAALPASVQAANYALVMAIDYRGTSAALPGIDKDADIARQIAEQLEVPKANIRSLSGADLTSAGVRRVLGELAGRVTRDDAVFIYYSGHGTQDSGSGGKCREGMVGADLQVIWNDELTQLLTRVAEGSSRMVIMNDSCFSGGQMSSDKAAPLAHGAEAPTPKRMDLASKSPSAAGGGYECGSPVNKAFRDIGAAASKRGNNYVYLAAASDQEVAFATPQGSSATRAWQACLANPDTDANHDGMVSGAELQQCAQREIDRMQFNQHIQVAGSTAMPLGGAHGGSGSAAVDPVTMLESLRARRNFDTGLAVSLQVDNPTLRIGRDFLRFTVTVPEEGYLYLLHTAADGKFYQLFPNREDQNNKVAAGRHAFPRASWALQAQGPERPEPGGLIAVLTKVPRDFTKELNTNGTFAEGDTDSSLSRALGVVATNSGRFGASEVARIREVR
jgi:hypothetical protein